MITVLSRLIAVKAVKFYYEPREDVLDLLETFRDMVNEALRIGFEKKPKTRFQLIADVYPCFKERYELHTHYTLGACECAFAMLRNRKWKKRPYAKHLFLKLDNQTYRLNYMLLKIPKTPRNFITLPLKGSDYQLSFLRDSTLKRGSITITDSAVVLAVSKTARVVEPLGKAVAYDVNEKNITSSNGQRYDLSHVANIGHHYSRIRASIAKNTHRDRRVKQRLLSKYGRREKRRAIQALHRVSKMIVEKAVETKSPIVLERLTGIRRCCRRGNRQGRKMRGRLNRWRFGELQRQIEYKAKWEGTPTVYARATVTSQTCSRCAYLNKTLKYERVWQCPNCGAILDRDLNATCSPVHSVDEGLANEGMVLHEAITKS
jgi:putative transposase